MTRRSSHRPAGRATDREVGAVAAVLVAGSEKAAAHRLGLSHATVEAPSGERPIQGRRGDDGAATTAQLVWILAPRLPDPDEARGYPARGGVLGNAGQGRDLRRSARSPTRPSTDRTAPIGRHRGASREACYRSWRPPTVGGRSWQRKQTDDQYQVASPRQCVRSRDVQPRDDETSRCDKEREDPQEPSGHHERRVEVRVDIKDPELHHTADERQREADDRDARPALPALPMLDETTA